MSSDADIRFRIEHIIESIERPKNVPGVMTFSQFAENETVIESALYRLQIAGEAAANIPGEFREEHPEFPSADETDEKRHRASVFRHRTGHNLGHDSRQLPATRRRLQKTAGLAS